MKKPYLFTTHTQNHITTFFALVWIELDFLSALFLVCSYTIFCVLIHILKKVKNESKEFFNMKIYSIYHYKISFKRPSCYLKGW